MGGLNQVLISITGRKTKVGRPANFCYAPVVMDEARLRSLMEQINSGQLSRNKNFEAFKDPVVRDARDRQTRIEAIKALVTEGAPREVRLDRDPKQNGIWRLVCYFPRWDLSWSAWLRDFELDLLADHPQLGSLISKNRV